MANMPTRLLILAVTMLLALAVAACDNGGETSEGPGLTSTAPLSTAAVSTASPQAAATITPFPGASECAGGSGGRLSEIQAEAPFQVYCPTWVPEGLTFLGSEYGGGVWLALLERTTLEATFVDAAGTTKVRFIQGRPDLDVALKLFTPTGETIAYGDQFQAEVYESLPNVPFAGPLLVAVTTTPDGFGRWIDGQGIDLEQLKRMAASMKPLQR